MTLTPCWMCEGAGSLDVVCSCGGMTPDYQCRRCLNSGYRGITCRSCDGTGRVSDARLLDTVERTVNRYFRGDSLAEAVESAKLDEIIC